MRAALDGDSQPHPTRETQRAAESRSLLTRRDRYIARRIGESLHPGEVGIRLPRHAALRRTSRRVGHSSHVSHLSAAAHGADNPMTALQGRPRVLIVDGDADIRDLLGQLVRDDGHEAIEAGDGEQALAVVGRHAAEVVFLDIPMPGESGLDVLRQMRHREPPPSSWSS